MSGGESRTERHRPSARAARLLVGASELAIAMSLAAPCVARADPAPFSGAWFAQRGAGGSAAAIASARASAALGGASSAAVQQSLANLRQAARAAVSAAALQGQARAAIAPSLSGAGLPSGIVAGPVADGLALGGLVPDGGLARPGVSAPVPSWSGAAAPVQTESGGTQTVTIRQTAQTALLNWRSLNVGAHTTLAFDQSAGGAAAPGWVALNRVIGGAPSLILGQITAPGHVLILNGNGILFAGSAQVNVGALLASTASITPAQFKSGGIYSPDLATPSFTGAAAPVIVQAGARIATAPPATATAAGGSVILLGDDVTNAGSISTPDGQTILAAGRDFVLRPGYGVTGTGSVTIPTSPTPVAGLLGNVTSTTRGTDVAVVAHAAGTGRATNAGIIEADRGDVTLAGHAVTQVGVALSTTTVSARGTIHLLTDRTDATASVVLAPGSVTSITPDPGSGTALDAQRAADITNSAIANEERAATPLLNDQTTLPDEQEQSRIEITAGGDVDVQAGALAVATGGQIAVSAPGRIAVEGGASLDVSGSVGVTLPASANVVPVNIQGFEQRDDPLNRDTARLDNATVYVEQNDLVTLAASAAYQNSPYTTADRLYTAGGLLEVSGEVGTIAHTIGEWTAPGGTITLSGADRASSVVQTLPGSSINVAGGSIDYQAGMVRTSWLIGPYGKIYSIDTAPASIAYTGVYQGFSSVQKRFAITQTYSQPLIAPDTVAAPAYSVGRDGGTFVVSAPTALLQGDIEAGTVEGAFQDRARTASIADPFLQPQRAVPLPGGLAIGNYGAFGLAGGFTAPVTIAFADAATIGAAIAGIATPGVTIPGVTIPGVATPGVAAVPAGAAAAGGAPALPASLTDTVLLDASQLDRERLGSVSVATSGTVVVADPVAVAPGGRIALRGAAVDIRSGLSAPSGTVVAGDLIASPIPTVPPHSLAGGASNPFARLYLESGASIDAGGRFTNAYLEPGALAGEAAANGGTVSLDTTGGLVTAPGSAIDVSAGAVAGPLGAVAVGTGGSVTLIGDDPNAVVATEGAPIGQSVPHGLVVLAGAVRSVGGGGTLSLAAPGFLITPSTTGYAADGRTVLAAPLFRQGFSSYVVNGYGNLPAPAPSSVPASGPSGLGAALPTPAVEVAAGTAIEAVVPTFLRNGDTLAAPGGTPTGAALSLTLPPTYLQNLNAATLTARAGASVSLLSKVPVASYGGAPVADEIGPGGDVQVDRGASVSVDPGQSIRLEAIGRITVDGALVAPSGSITLQDDTYEPGTTSRALSYRPDLSVWVGSTGRLDASSRAVTAFDRYGRPYGLASSGGTIVVGGARGLLAGATPAPISTDAYVVIAPGAVLDASGSQTTVDLAAGYGPTRPSALVPIEGGGGAISLNSLTGLAIGGTLRAAAGGPDAAGGSLTVDLVKPVYGVGTTGFAYTVPDALRVAEQIVVSAVPAAFPLAATLAPGQAGVAALQGTAALSSDQVASGGFATLTLSGSDFPSFGPDQVRFAGSVELRTAQAIALPGVLTDDVPDASVSISAPYVTFNSNAVTGFGIGVLAGQLPAASTIAPTAHLSVAAGQIEIGDGTIAGVLDSIALNTIPNGNGGLVTPRRVTDDPGFATASFSSRGDVVFVPPGGASGGGSFGTQSVFASGGDVSFTASELTTSGFNRPTGQNFTVALGLDGVSAIRGRAHAGTLAIARTPGSVPTPPLSAGNGLTLIAADIEQGGVIDEPFGTVTLGAGTFNGQGTVAGYTDRVAFLPGSVTSVSGIGQVQPFGGTPDGVTYSLGGTSLTPNTIGGVPVFRLAPQVTTIAQSVSIAPGAAVDLRGGGTLAGAAFNSGRGGSTDVLTTPFTVFDGSSARTPADPVYAILPGFHAAPPAGVNTEIAYAGVADAAPPTGAQVTVGAGVPGLAAGTYALLPAYDALLPGAFRVELQPGRTPAVLGATDAGNLSTAIAVTTSVAGTGFAGTTPIGAVFTDGAAIRRLSSYDEQGYGSYVTAYAATFDIPRTAIPADSGTLVLDYNLPQPLRVPPAPALVVEGDVLSAPGAGGYGGSTSVIANVIPAGLGANDGFLIVSDAYVPPAAPPAPDGFVATPSPVLALRASDLERIGTESLVIGGSVSRSALIGTIASQDYVPGASTVEIGTGASLAAPEVDLIGQASITVDRGARIDTSGLAAPRFMAPAGVTYSDADPNSGGGAAVLAVSNAPLRFSPPGVRVAGTIDVKDGATLVSDGSIGFVTAGAVNIGDAATLATRSLSLSLSILNIAPTATLPAGIVVPNGVTLPQTVIDGLFAGGANGTLPKLQQVVFTASDAIDLFGTLRFGLPSGDPGQVLEFNTPSIYGQGSATDTATIEAGTFVWNGITSGSGIRAVAAQPAGTLLNGPGSGAGGLVVDARDIVLGYAVGENRAATGALVVPRATYGFGQVTLGASGSLSANGVSSLSAFQTEGPTTAAGRADTGGALTIRTPLVTSAPGARLLLRTGGAITLATTGAGVGAGAAGGTGGEIDLSGASIGLSTSVVLPEGRLVLSAPGDIALGPSAAIDLSGRATAILGQTIDGPGGTLVAESGTGGISLAPGGSIAIGGAGTAASGTIELTALSGAVSLGGALSGGGAAGGAQAGTIDVRAGTLADFAGLNRRLTAGGLDGARRFEIATGDLVIGPDAALRASDIEVSVDTGTLAVDGRIDASGAAPGTISLSSGGSLTVGAGAVLDAHGSVAQTDLTGATIDSENTARVTLRVADGPGGSNLAATRANGTLTLAPGATIDVRAAPGVGCALGACGQVELEAPRTGSTDGSAPGVAVSATGPVTILGAGSVAVDGFWSVAPADGVVDQAVIDAQGAVATRFVAGAVPNGALAPALATQLAGLAAYRGAFHLRPGIEIDSLAANDGDLTVSGDLDLSGLRFASVAPGRTLDPKVAGSGEPGVLRLRAANQLNVYGSVNDGFADPADGTTAATQNPDDNGWNVPTVDSYLQFQNSQALNIDQDLILPDGADPVTLAAGTTFLSTATVNYEIPVASGTLAAGTVLPVSFTLQGALTIPPAGEVAQGDVLGPDGTTVLYPRGTLIAGGTTIAKGDSLGAGFVLPSLISYAATNAVTGLAQTWPANLRLTPFGDNGATLANDLPLETGDLIPAGTAIAPTDFAGQINLRQPVTLANGLTTQGKVFAVSPLLPAGSLSWSFDLVSGANPSAADPTRLAPATALAASGQTGDLVLSDLHFEQFTTAAETAANPGVFVPLPSFSVIRTGTGSLGLRAGGNLIESSTYGIYTAGTQSAGVEGSAYDPAPGAAALDAQFAVQAAIDRTLHAGYPTGGGDLAVAAQHDLVTTSFASEGIGNATTSPIGAWLHRQGGSAADPGAYWINFGNYEPVYPGFANTVGTELPILTGFTGIGTLGGGNLAVTVGHDAGTEVPPIGTSQIPTFILQTDQAGTVSLGGTHDNSLTLAVGATGRATASGTVQTGGGRLALQVGDTLDPGLLQAFGSNSDTTTSTVIGLRGPVAIGTGRSGAVDASTTAASPISNPYFTSITGGAKLVLGDASATITTRGDLALTSVGDATRQATFDSSRDGLTAWFTLWQPTSSVTLLSTGGDVSPFQAVQTGGDENRLVYPPILAVDAQAGGIFYNYNGPGTFLTEALETAPSPVGQIDFLAETSIVGADNVINARGYPLPRIDLSGADPSLLPTVANPAYVTTDPAVARPLTNVALQSGVIGTGLDELFVLAPDTPTTALHAADPTPAHFYAATGDIENLVTGETISFPSATGVLPSVQYLAAKPVDIEAGRDIVSLGDPAGSAAPTAINLATSKGGLFWQNVPTDLSRISAGRDIVYANAQVAGPGLLQVVSGGNLYQGGNGVIESIGSQIGVTPANRQNGAGISVETGVTAANTDLAAFARLYLDPANTADPAVLLADQPGKVVRTYQAELISFLQARTGYRGGPDGALAAFGALPTSLQSVLLLPIYAAELNRSGLDYSDPSSRFYKSYQEGNEAIRTLFPNTDLTGRAPPAGGSITLFGQSGFRTDFGGSLQFVVPDGTFTVGVPGAVPPASAGLITQGSGDIDLYSYGSIPLGQSRIFTTFGGNILIWMSSDGIVNLGQGSKSTILFTPPQIAYDALGGVTLSPTVPSTGAGIATLAPVAGIPPGNVNIVTPVGTIDLGEAGLRSSGNVNLVALTVVNAANVQATGAVSGLPTVAVPNVAAITAASAAAGSASNAARQTLAQTGAQRTPSVISVEVISSSSSGDSLRKRKV